MVTNRLELALELLKSSDWERFEKLASRFLASEFDDIRTVASAGGDGGRDSELFSPQHEPSVIFQYSVAEDWSSKINGTVKRIKKTFPHSLVLIYVTSQQIGAKADALKKKLRTESGLTLDIRDRSWFCDRVHHSQSKQIAAEEIAELIVDPYLANKLDGNVTISELSTPEAIAALTFLGLQWQDDVRDKGLTKLAFGALVRSALIDTDSENKISKDELYTRISKVLPGHPKEQLKQPIDSAVKALGKTAIKIWPGEQLCLAHDEVLRFREYRAANELAEKNLMISIAEIIEALISKATSLTSFKDTAALMLRSIADAVIFEKSQAFAMAVQSGDLTALAKSDFKSNILIEISKTPPPKAKGFDWVSAFQSGVSMILTSDKPAIQEYLRSTADSYTLLAFLKQTPDVQNAVEKMFSNGKLWLDTTVLLPLIAETLSSSDGEGGRFTRMISAAKDVGLKLHVTQGVIEEVERHMNRALVCARMDASSWNGAVPYLLEKYIANGRSITAFPEWLDNFRGESRPLDDLAEYLKDFLSIQERSLISESESAPQELRNALQAIWLERYERRKEKYGANLDDMAISRLISHDVECYAGVVQLRTQEKSSPFGYSAWWLTVDRQTFDLKSKLRSHMKSPPPDSPVISADFLVNYLAFGPLRRRVSKSTESQLPLLMVLGNVGQLSPELMAEAESLRAQLTELPERMIRRKVRDHLDRARAAIGPISTQGMDDVDEAISTDIADKLSIETVI